MSTDLEGSALYIAVVQGEIEAVYSSLTNKTFCWDIPDEDKDDYIFRCALEKAIELDRQDVVGIMLQAQFEVWEYGGMGSCKPKYVAEALETAARLGKQNIVKQILETETDNIRSISNALAHGTWSRKLQILQMLMDAGASVGSRVICGITRDIQFALRITDAAQEIHCHTDR